MTFLHGITLGLFAVSLAMHAAASKLHFTAPAKLAARSIVVVVCFAVAAGLNLIYIERGVPRLVPFIASVALYLSALWLFIAAIQANRQRPLSVAFTGDQPGHLVMTGPYRYVRHPFYASYCLTWVAGAVASLSLVLTAVAACMTLLYWLAARFEERKFAASEFADAYAGYRDRTGMFIPRLSSQGFESAVNWALIIVGCALAVSVVRSAIAPAKPSADGPQHGALVHLEGVRESRGGRTLVMALYSGCHYCTDSAPLYRRLESMGSERLKMVAVLSDAADAGRAYLASLGLAGVEVAKGGFEGLRIAGTPTLILLDRNGRVEKTWVGRLNPSQEQELVNAILAN